MKFAKELEQDLVPEWRAKYFDYKLGKKKVKAVTGALKNVNQTPKTPGRQLPANLLYNKLQSPIRNRASTRTSSAQSTPDNRVSGLTSYGSAKDTLQDGTWGKRDELAIKTVEEEGSREEEDGPSPLAIPCRTSQKAASDESTSAWDSGAVTNYGSFVASPPARNVPLGPPVLELPDPALPPDEESYARHNRAWRKSHFNPNPHTTPPSNRLEGSTADVYRVGPTHVPPKLDSSPLLPKPRRTLKPNRTMSTPGGGATPALRPRLLRRIFSSNGMSSPRSDIPLEAYQEYDARNTEYFAFLDKELEKIEAFYKMKENQATARLQLLRDQLHEMRDRRIQEVRMEQLAREQAARDQKAGKDDAGADHQVDGHRQVISKALNWVKPLESVVGLGPSRIGRVTKSLQQNVSPYGPQPQFLPDPSRPESQRDYQRRPTHPDDVPYRSAKRKLKLALQEFYRGLELLKSYALLNRTAFRKLNKKYDKAVKARPIGRYMSEKVNKAWFVQSEVLEGQLVAIEDLYARYFERGNHKVAVGKLRSKNSRAGEYNGSVFRNGLMFAAGVVLAIQGVVYGAEHLDNPDPGIRLDASYLLQIYGGYFLGLFLFLLFCLDCKVWTKAKINYPFIFEFDSRHNLDWHQLAELPCFLLFLLGLFMWLNFQQDNANFMFLYWPVVLIGLTVIIIFFPGPILYHRSREWWAYSNFRLLLAGWYPVEFRDFFLGDMYCSLTYSMGNLELFFCLYAQDWSNPGQCNSTHSRLLGFFCTVPGLWRAFQCIRRYYDTRNAFPHLVNCGKYTFTILFYMTLSLYRMDENKSLKALFITCATINSIYCSIWDLAMDWSLLNPYAEHRFLRNVLGYKNPWVYYLAMILDPILRFNWIFYAIYSSDLQHSALLSFFVGISEVCRRGMWTLFRVENEHCTNVGRFRASRDVPLPYELEPTTPPSPHEETNPEDAEAGQVRKRHRPHEAVPHPTPADAGISSNLESQPSSGTLRRRQTPNTPISRGIQRVGTIMREAHAQDFERKRRPEAAEASPHHGRRSIGVESSDEEEDEDGDLGNEGQGEAGREERMQEREEDEEDMAGVEDVLRRHRSATDR